MMNRFIPTTMTLRSMKVELKPLYGKFMVRDTNEVVVTYDHWWDHLCEPGTTMDTVLTEEQVNFIVEGFFDCLTTQRAAR